ncbi:MAG TPA: hypothetical protein ENH40_06730 [Nitrospirae bacterium]|nr:hypothetical protein [Nitrospirota bacterium]
MPDEQEDTQGQSATQGRPDNLETYIGCKVIRACPMDECSFLRTQGKDVTNRETRPGYKVIYPDGYVSWSPKNVFEEAYRKINNSEAAMCR